MTQTLTTDELRQIAETDHTQCGDAAAMARELLANREAQPVAFYGVTGNNCAYYNTRKGAIKDGCEDITPLYTAPPAPAVPEEMTGDGVLTMHDCGYIEGWNACRAAMLAQPVSGGYKLNSPEIPDGCHWTFDEHDSTWDSGCGEAWMFSDGGPTENGVKFCQSCGKPVLLAAAPEGGNEK